MLRLLALAPLVLFSACTADMPPPAATGSAADSFATYAPFRLTTDVGGLSDADRRILPLLIEAAKEMDAVFQREAYGNLDSLLATLDDEAVRDYVRINYGPWDRLNDNAPFVPGVGPKPAGANFYPPGVTADDVNAASDPALKSLYTMVRRDAAGNLTAIPYHEFFAAHVNRAADLLDEAAEIAEDAGFEKYLRLRAQALRTDEYQPSDLAWMDMKTNTLDVVIGPIENYEDGLLGAKAAHEAYVLVKDQAWSDRLARYAALLPALQHGLPVEDRYKQETPGSESDLGAYDAVYYAGDSNAGSKTIAINLPNDEEVQLKKGTRRLQLKNAMQAKFDAIMEPLADVLIAPDQRGNVTFDAFFGNTMFHEVAHGLGIKNTVAGAGTVREALREHYSALEEGKADVLGLYMVRQLIDSGDWDGSLEDHYATFLAGIFRSIRFGAASAHGRANMIRFNYFAEKGAFTRDGEGYYHVNPEAMQQAVDALSADILRLQGDGDYDAVAAFVDKYGTVTPELEADLARVNDAGIPVDIVFEQGVDVLGL